MQLATSTRHREGVTLVHCRLRNDDGTPRRVRVASRLDGPVWFPRRDGYPAAGWDAGGFEGVLAAGETRALGYASPAEPVDPPAEIAWTERAAGPDDDRADGARRPADAALAAARTLADPRPPRDAVPAESPDDNGSPAPAVADAGPADSADAGLAEFVDDEQSVSPGSDDGRATTAARLAALRDRLGRLVRR